MPLWLKNSVTQPLGRGDPDVAALKVNSENVVVSRRRGDCHRSYIALAHRAPSSPACLFQEMDDRRPSSRRRSRPALCLCQTMRGWHPRPLPQLVKFEGKPAVLGKKVMPIAAVVAAVSEICCRPQDIVDKTHRSRNLVDQPLVLEQHNLGFAVGIFVLVPDLRLLVVLQNRRYPTPRNTPWLAWPRPRKPRSRSSACCARCRATTGP